jgi:hypothetical protein
VATSHWHRAVQSLIFFRQTVANMLAQPQSRPQPGQSAQSKTSVEQANPREHSMSSVKKNARRLKHLAAPISRFSLMLRQPLDSRLEILSLHIDSFSR